jgi:hypothetical protein
VVSTSADINKFDFVNSFIVSIFNKLINRGAKLRNVTAGGEARRSSTERSRAKPSAVKKIKMKL